VRAIMVVLFTPPNVLGPKDSIKSFGLITRNTNISTR